MAKWTLPVLCLAGMVLLLLPEFFSQSGMEDGGPHQGPPMVSWRIASMDTNQDGQVTLEEAQAARPEMTATAFKAYDTNGDGVWNGEDRRGGYRTLTGRRRMEDVDLDSDGKVTKEEYMTACQEEFTRLDIDTDNTLIPEEWPRRYFGGPPPMAGLDPMMPFPPDGPQGDPPGPPPAGESGTPQPDLFPPGSQRAEEGTSSQ